MAQRDQARIFDQTQEPDNSNFRKRKYPFNQWPSVSEQLFPGPDKTPSSHMFTTYEKKQGIGQHLGGEYQYLLCALYALKFCADDRISDFQLTTNNDKYKVFDDITIEINLKDKPDVVFTFQLKHGEPQRNLTIGDFIRQNLKNKSYLKNPFCLTKHIEFVKSVDKDNIVCILFTNNTTSLVDDLELDFETDKLLVKVCDDFPHKNLLINTQSANSGDIFHLKINNKNGEENCSKQFYIFSNQNNVHRLKQSIEDELRKLLRCDIYGFFDFMKNWWAGKFILTKTDMLIKLTELSLGPYTRTLCGDKCNQKTKQLTNIIMNFDTTIVEGSDDNIISNIWESGEVLQKVGSSSSEYEMTAFCLHSNIQLETFCLAALKYGLKTLPVSVEVLTPAEISDIVKSLSPSQISKVLWYLDVVPLVVKVNNENREQVESVLYLWTTHFKKKKIVLLDPVKENIEEKRRHCTLLCNLADVLNYDKDAYVYIINNCYVSLQGRQDISLKQLLQVDQNIISVFGVQELLEMTQRTLLVGKNEVTLPDLYITRSLSSVKFVDTNKLLKFCEDATDTLIIINCEKRLEFAGTAFSVVELVEFLQNRKHDKLNNLIILSTSGKCSINQFEKVHQLSNKSVYLFQVFNEKCCILLLKKGYALPLFELEYQQYTIEDRETLKYFNNPLNYLIAPVGWGKSTLLTFLTKMCPPDSWTVYIDLRTFNSFLETSPYEELLHHFMQISKDDTFVNKFKNALAGTKKLYLFLDELDQVKHTDFLLDFVKWLSSIGASVWVASRDHLEEKIEGYLNIVPLKLQALTNEQQKEHFVGTLKRAHWDHAVEVGVNVLFRSLELANSRHLLASPLNLRILIDVVNDQAVLERLESQKIATLPALYSWLFDGFLKYYHEKIGLHSEMIGFDNFRHYYLEQYQALSLKSCLEEQTFNKLSLNPRYINTFLSHVKQHGDGLGIIRKVEEDHPSFIHQTFAEYFASLWLSENLDFFCSPDKNFFFPESHLRFILDAMLAVNNPLHLSIIYRDLRNIDTFDVSKDKGGRTPLHLACSYGNHYPTNTNCEELITRESESYVKLVEELMEKYDALEYDELFSFTSVMYAIRSGCLFPLEKVLERFDSGMLDHLLEIYNTKTLAYYSAQLGYYNLLSFVIEHDLGVVNEDFGAVSLLELAVIGANNDDYKSSRKGNVRVVEMLLKHYDDEDLLYRTLTLASSKQCYDMIRVLIRLDTKRTGGKSLLHVAAEMGTLNEEMLKLSMKDVDLNVRDNEGKTALHYAVMSSAVDVVKFLIGKGVDVNARDSEGLTSLYLASNYGNEYLVNLLLKSSLDWTQEERRLSTNFQTNLTIDKASLENMKTDPSEKSSFTIFDAQEKTFSKRLGTTDRGRDYEHLVMGQLLLKLITDPNVKNFQLSANDSRFGNFDDLVVSVETQTNATTYALQIKHTEKAKPISARSLTQSKGVFSIIKFFQSYQEIPKSYTYNFVYFTNGKCSLESGTDISIETDQLKVQVEKILPEPFLSTDKRDEACYKFRITPDSHSHRRVADYQNFFDHFFMYTDQENVHGMERKISKKFISLFRCTREMFSQYLNFLSTWNAYEGEKEKLSKRWVEISVAIILLHPFVKPLSFGSVSDKMRLFREAIAKFSVTVAEERTYDVIRQLWGDLKSEIEDLGLFNKIARKYQLISDYLNRIEDVDDKLLNTFFWIMGKCPLIVPQNPSVYKTFHLCQNQKFIILGNDTNVWIADHTVFQKLSDLKPFTIYSEILKEFKFSVQEKEETNLEYLIKLDEEFADLITPTDLVDMLKDIYRVGDEKEILPVSYINRYLSRNVISSEYLKEVDCNNTFILLCDAKGNNLRIIPDSSNSFSEDEFASKKFEDFCNSAVGAKVFHQFKVMDDGNLEWLRSRGGVNDLYQHQLSGYFVEETDVYSNCQNKVNIVCTDPGMGKTELMRSLKNGTQLLTLLLRSKEMSLLCSKMNENSANKSLEEVREIIFNLIFANFQPLEEKILKVLIKTGQVCYIWDGLDELSVENKDVMVDLIEKLSSRSLTQWVAARSYLKKELENKFSVFVRNLHPLTNDEQYTYIKKCLQNDIEGDVIEDIIVKLKSLLRLPNSEDILGCPLQLYMLTELIRQRDMLDKILSHKIFSICDLYSHFTEQKFEIYFRREVNVNAFGPIMKKIKREITEIYENCAVRTLFPDEAEIHLASDELEEDYLGLLINNNFVYTSYAEYFAANYLHRCSKNSIHLKLLFDAKYSNVRFFFDLLLAKNSAPHVTVLCRHYDLLKMCDGFENSKDVGGRSPLHLACSWGTRFPLLQVEKKGNAYVIIDDDSASQVEDVEYIKILDFLLEKCDTAEVDNLFEMTPLSYAEVTDSLFAKIKILLKENKTFDNVDEVSNNVFYYSVRLGISEALVLFKDLPFVSTATNQNSMLHLAVHDEKVMENLLKAETYRNVVNHRNKYGETPLYLACQLGNRSTALLLTRFDADVNSANSSGLSPLHAVSHSGHIECAQLLVKCGADINSQSKYGTTALHVSCQAENPEITEMLVRSGANINVRTIDGLTPLYLAVQNGHEKCVESLMKCGANINMSSKDGTTSLHLACQSGNLECAQLLVECGADINSQSKYGTTPLHVSCQAGHLEITEMLVRSGADINVRTIDGLTPLHLAVQNGHEKCVESLMKCGANINMSSKDGTTPLHVACERGCITCVKILIQAEADMNVATRDGNTPLHIACVKGWDSIVRLLVNFGANVIAANNEHMTPLEVALREGFAQIAEFLKNI